MMAAYAELYPSGEGQGSGKRSNPRHRHAFPDLAVTTLPSAGLHRARDTTRVRLLRKRHPEPVAQSVEHVTFNHGVLGSNPSGLTISPFQLRHPSPWNLSAGIALAWRMAKEPPPGETALLCIFTDQGPERACLPASYRK